MIDFPDEAEEEFPLGDGTADTEAEVYCPWCGAPSVIALDPGSGAEQEYVEDCQVCCRPCVIRVRFDKTGAADVEVRGEG